MRKLRRTPLIKRGPLPLRYVFLITFVFFNIFTVLSLIMINKNLEPSLMSIAETKARQIAAQAINDAVSKKITEDIDISELIILHNVGNGKVTYSTNPQVYNRVISETALRIQRYLDFVEEGDIERLESFRSDINIDYEASKKQNGIVYNVPLGMATKTTLFSNLGPKIPVRFEILGDVIPNVETKIVETGINNTYIEIYVVVSVKMNVIIPLIEEPIEIVNSVKIGDLFIEGEVPQFYQGGGGNGGIAPVFIPAEDSKQEEENNDNN